MGARYVKLWLFAAVFFTATLCGLKDARAAFPLLTGNDMWNVTITGFTVGSGNIQFIDDLTLGKVVAGYIFIKEKAVQNKNAPDPFHVGSFLLLGEWTIDASGTVTGFMSGGSQAVPLDISFTAKGKDLTSITMTGADTNGPIHMKGVPVSAVLTPDLTGSWHATTLKDGKPFVELFDLIPSQDFCIDVITTCDLTVPAINLYDLQNGAGPGYLLEGNVLVSSRGQIALVAQESASSVIRSVTGKLSAKNTPFKASMSGSDDNQVAVKTSMSQ
jgi:hypothetical protein